MEVAKMTYTYENKELGINVGTIMNSKQMIYFKGKDVAEALGYAVTDQAIRIHVEEDDKEKLQEIRPFDSKGLTENQKNTIYINESGLYTLILGSKLPTARMFKRWVTSAVLPSIRKFGHYRHFNNPNNDCFKIEDEEDLHVKVVSYIRKFYPECLLIAGLGENQTTKELRLKSKMKGYQKGQPDLIITNLHKYYSGFCIEFKTPKKNGILSKEQKEMLKDYEDSNYKTLVSSDYDVVVKHITEYMQFVRIKCYYCKRKFINKDTRKNHIKWVHKIK